MSVLVKLVPNLPSAQQLPFFLQEWLRQLWISGNQAWTNFTPVTSGFTVVGTPTYTGRYRTIGRKCEFQIQFNSTTTIATVAGTSYIELPVQPVTNQLLSGLVVMSNKTTNVAVGIGHVDVTNLRAYLPAQAASGNTFTVYGEYEI